MSYDGGGDGPHFNIAILALLAVVSWIAALTLLGFVLWTIRAIIP